MDETCLQGQSRCQVAMEDSYTVPLECIAEEGGYYTSGSVCVCASYHVAM